MTRRRWIADEHDGARAALTGANAAHLSRVLRARIGQEFDIAVRGEVRRGVITSVTEERVEFELGDVVESSEQRQVTILLAIFKFDRFEWAIEKCTELGIDQIVPVIARRTEPHLAQAATKRVERWRRIAHEAAQQSRRSAVPEIAEPIKLKDALKVYGEGGILLAETERQSTLLKVLTAFDEGAAVTLAIGPEGGWAEEELKLFAESGWKSASLGSTVLRAETAAMASLAIVRALSMPGTNAKS